MTDCRTMGAYIAAMTLCACVKARRSRPRSGLAFTRATPPYALGWVVTAKGRRNPCRTKRGVAAGGALRGRLPAAFSEDSRAREARLDLYQGHLTDEERKQHK